MDRTVLVHLLVVLPDVLHEILLNGLTETFLSVV